MSDAVLLFLASVVQAGKGSVSPLMQAPGRVIKRYIVKQSSMWSCRRRSNSSGTSDWEQRNGRRVVSWQSREMRVILQSLGYSGYSSVSSSVRASFGIRLG